MKAFSITDIGKRRDTNEDCVYRSESPIGNLPNLFIVADGMGGHNAGDFASQQTVAQIVSYIRTAKDVEPERIIEKAIAKANSYIRDKSLEDEKMSGMGTTVVVATYSDGQLVVANIGDSRLYIINNDIIQITRDHSLVEEMVIMGGIDRASARNHPDKNIITRAVGVKDRVSADFFSVRVSTTDTILMCTDGLTNMVEDEEIKQIINKDNSVEQVVYNLIQAANEHGGKDNIGVIIIRP